MIGQVATVAMEVDTNTLGLDLVKKLDAVRPSRSEWV